MNTPATVTRVVFFCDCHHFLLLTRELGDVLLEFTDSFYQQCGECIASRGGRIIKYIGDSILATFSENGADDAVAAGICARAEYASLVDRYARGVESELEVGISRGQVVEGIVGHESHRAFDILGECVNEAAIIGHHRGVAVTDEVRELLSGKYETRALEPRRLKSRDEPLAIWEIVGG
jgi:class 3 adenylate cyclase